MFPNQIEALKTQKTGRSGLILPDTAIVKKFPKDVIKKQKDGINSIEQVVTKQKPSKKSNDTFSVMKMNIPFDSTTKCFTIPIMFAVPGSSPVAWKQSETPLDVLEEGLTVRPLFRIELADTKSTRVNMTALKIFVVPQPEGVEIKKRKAAVVLPDFVDIPLADDGADETPISEVSKPKVQPTVQTTVPGVPSIWTFGEGGIPEQQQPPDNKKQKRDK